MSPFQQRPDVLVVFEVNDPQAVLRGPNCATLFGRVLLFKRNAQGVFLHRDRDFDSSGSPILLTDCFVLGV